MDSLTLVHRLFTHLTWADELLWSALATERPGEADAWREYSHIIGAEEVWLSRIEGRASRLPIWPQVSRDELRAGREQVVPGYTRFLETLTAESLDAGVSYRNTAGVAFTTKLVDILVHVALHGQYHRGKINLLLRQTSVEPVPTDYISFVRGVPAAVTQAGK
jgi:uncharacterized damage-inducible protein DinB